MKKRILTIALVMAFCAAGAFAAPKKGSMKDPRDGHKYKTVQIGNQTWMSENLSYKMDGSASFCNAKACKEYGRWYNWNAATKACPTGWHLPSNEEFEALVAAVGGKSAAGKTLRAKKGWSNGGPGTDPFGFSALSAGMINGDEDESGEGEYAYFWGSTESNGDEARYVYFGSDSDEISFENGSKGFLMFSVRCLKD